MKHPLDYLLRLKTQFAIYINLALTVKAAVNKRKEAAAIPSQGFGAAREKLRRSDFVDIGDRNPSLSSFFGILKYSYNFQVFYY